MRMCPIVSPDWRLEFCVWDPGAAEHVTMSAASMPLKLSASVEATGYQGNWDARLPACVLLIATACEILQELVDMWADMPRPSQTISLHVLAWFKPRKCWRLLGASCRRRHTSNASSSTIMALTNSYEGASTGIWAISRWKICRTCRSGTKSLISPCRRMCFHDCRYGFACTRMRWYGAFLGHVPCLSCVSCEFHKSTARMKFTNLVHP